MTVDTHVVTATISPGGLDAVAPVLSGTLTMDQGWVPYHQGSITVPMDVADLSPYLPDNVLPIRIDASVVGDPDQTEQWNLHVRHIREDHLAGTYTLEVASAEALVQDWGITPVNVVFPASHGLSLICRDVLRQVLGDPELVVFRTGGADPLPPDEMRVWTAGTRAWDYLAEICASQGNRTLFLSPFGGWILGTPEPNDFAPVSIPQPEDALSYIREWTRDGDGIGNAVTVEFTGGTPTYTTVAVPGSSPAVAVEVEVKRFGQGYLPITLTSKPALVKAHDTSVPTSRGASQATRDRYARNLRRRHSVLGYSVTWRTVSNYGVRARMEIAEPVMYIDRVTHDFGTNEMTVSAHLPYSGESPV